MAKVFKTLKKKAQATPLVGVILDSLKSENPRQNAPSIQAVLDNMTPPQNLLINGDFKIWQRGTTFSDIANQYTADMWRIENAAAPVTLVERSTDVPSNADCNYSIHLKDTQSTPNFYLIQKGMNFKGSFVLSFWHKSNKNFPTYYIDGSGTHLLGVNEPSSEWKYVSYKFSSNNLSTLNIIQGTSNGDFYIASVRLYRGEIDYPHVEEDDAIALMRCQRKVYKGVLYALPYGISSGTQYWFQGVTNYPIEMDAIPNITYLNINVANTGTLTSDKIISISNTKKYLGKIMKVDVGMQIEANSYVRNPMLIDFIASCEPL